VTFVVCSLMVSLWTLFHWVMNFSESSLM